MSEVEWRGRSVPVKIDKARIFLLGLGDNEAAIAQVSQYFVSSYSLVLGKNELHFIQCEAIDVSISWYHSLQVRKKINAGLSLCVQVMSKMYGWIMINYDDFETMLWSIKNQTGEEYQ